MKIYDDFFIYIFAVAALAIAQLGLDNPYQLIAVFSIKALIVPYIVHKMMGHLVQLYKESIGLVALLSERMKGITGPMIAKGEQTATIDGWYNDSIESLKYIAINVAFILVLLSL
jgi:membrane protein implicated in regulation of membrane protease activity